MFNLMSHAIKKLQGFNNLEAMNCYLKSYLSVRMHSLANAGSSSNLNFLCFAGFEEFKSLCSNLLLQPKFAYLSSSCESTPQNQDRYTLLKQTYFF